MSNRHRWSLVLMEVSVRTTVCKTDCTYVQELVQNKLMTDYAVGPGGSLNLLNMSFFFFFQPPYGEKTGALV